MPPSDLFGKSLTVFEFKLYGLVFCDFPEVPQFDLTEDNDCNKMNVYFDILYLISNMYKECEA